MVGWVECGSGGIGVSELVSNKLGMRMGERGVLEWAAGVRCPQGQRSHIHRVIAVG